MRSLIANGASVTTESLVHVRLHRTSLVLGLSRPRSLRWLVVTDVGVPDDDPRPRDGSGVDQHVGGRVGSPRADGRAFSRMGGES